MANKSRAERNNAIALLASFLVIAAGLAGALVVCTISAPDPKIAIPVAIGIFVLIAMIPIAALRDRSSFAGGVRVRGPSLWKRIRLWWIRWRHPKQEPDEAPVWKRRKSTSWVKDSVFVADKPDRKPPFQG